MNFFIRIILKYIFLLFVALSVISCSSIKHQTTFVIPTKTSLPNIILLGKPGSGKGTLSEALVNYHGYVHISVGDLLRNRSKEKTPLGSEIRSLLKKRKMMHGNIIVKILDKEIVKAISENKKFILDGFPADTLQLDYLNRVMQQYNLWTNTILIVIDISDKNALSRLKTRIVCPKCGKVYNTKALPPKNKNRCDKCGHKIIKRTEDSFEVAKKRMFFYRQQTVPVINLLKKHIKVYTIGVRLNGCNQKN